MKRQLKNQPPRLELFRSRIRLRAWIDRLDRMHAAPPIGKDAADEKRRVAELVKRGRRLNQQLELLTLASGEATEREGPLKEELRVFDRMANALRAELAR
ncbi:hypothetical protein [Engelhardtia mirabilis]|uniref:Uncharacterized protein n=1 Tax=Engelhardtia mirabilis TaxID=2528011 RepID=A0A518BSV6_9BACT|nr:hypothetical protein Pla133_51770 [Planctomycetes bacterium Pla133]QDV04379.1 hypothetical protein Pla86_51740 [Planctomycetes bacterium Pla86]